MESIETDCCIVGGGPAGIMLGLLLARAGIHVVVLEKHADFLRDFRGDTVHPSTLTLLNELGLMDDFNKLPQQRVNQLTAMFGSRLQPMVDFSGLKPFDYMALVPQWDFLNLLAQNGRKLPHFELRTRHEAISLERKNDTVVGVRADSPDGEISVTARVTVACDGRNSSMREQSGLKSTELGAPMDVLWFHLPRDDATDAEPFAIVDSGCMMVLLNRTSYWQVAYVVPKGTDEELRKKPVSELTASVKKLAPFLENAPDAVNSWDDIKTLEVRVNHLERWYRKGLLVIGDAAHAMSPIGGVGINLAIQDAVATANILAPALHKSKTLDVEVFRQVQQRRLPAALKMQRVQLMIQKRIISAALDKTSDVPDIPGVLRWLLKFRVVRRIPARVIGYGFQMEHVKNDAR